MLICIKIDGLLNVWIKVFIPESLKDDEATLTFNFNKITIKEFSDNDRLLYMCTPFDKFCADSENITDANSENISKTASNPEGPPAWCKNYYEPLYCSSGYYYYMYFVRQISQEDLENMDILEKMPGFRVTWDYHLDENYAAFGNDTYSIEFVR